MGLILELDRVSL